MHSANSKAIADDVRLSFVASLYEKRGTLFAGMVAHVIAATAIYLRLDDPYYLFCAFALFGIWSLRILDMQAFDLCDKSVFVLSDTLHWERRYVAGPVAGALVLGIMCAYALVVSRDPFAELVSISITLASMISVVGRNFGSKLNVDMMILSACIPLMGGFLMLRDPYMIVMAMLLLPLFLTTRDMANGVRDFLFNTVIAERKTAEIAERFDTALNNMSHGLFMLDGEGLIEVINHKAREIFELDSTLDLRGRSLRAALRLKARDGGITRDNLIKISKQLDKLVSGKDVRSLIKFDDKVWLEFTSRQRNSNGVVLIFEDVTSRIEQDERILHMARFDNLTGLPNRTWFREKVDLKLSNRKCGRNVALVVLDIDDFKHVNDTMGHVNGDKLLSAVAARLRSIARQKVVVSRFGGDEFVLFVSDISDEAHLNEFMRHVLDTLCGTYVIDRHKLFINFSAGVSLSPVTDAQIEDMHIQADLALYESKRHDKENWVLFEQAMDQEYNRRQRLKTDLRDAIQTQSLTLVYQPMFNIEGTRIVGAEALSRWNHPDFGPVSPAVYIALAEEMGIVGELTRSVVMQAVRTCKTWPPEMFVSVNLSAHDLGDHAIVSVISNALAENDLAPERLQIEVTEGGLMKDIKKAREVLSELRQMGMTIAIDDFGTGYSSLSYLDILPLNKVKIDRSFISHLTEDPRKLKLLRGVVNLSRELGLDIIVEGVETEAQLTLIRDNNCADVIQGYIFGAPMLESAFAELAVRLSQSNASVHELSVAVRA